MSTLSQFGGGVKPPTALINYCSDAGSYTTANAPGSYSLKRTLSGATTANTLKSVLNITGSGVISFLSAHCADGTSRTVRLKVTLDGVVVFDTTSIALSTAGFGLIAIGDPTAFDPITFNKSLLVEIASSLSETDKLYTNYYYRLT